MVKQKATVQFRYRIIYSDRHDNFEKIAKESLEWLVENKVPFLQTYEGKSGSNTWEYSNDFVLRFRSERDMLFFMLTIGSKSFQIL